MGYLGDPRAIWDLARRREATQSQWPSHNKMSSKYWIVGILGEAAFADKAGLPMNMEDQPMGDGGWDFDTPIGKIDSKATEIGPGKWQVLPVNPDKVVADIYFLSWVRFGGAWGQRRIKQLGWCRADVVRAAPIRGMKIPGVRKHHVQLEQLQDMELLYQLLKQ